MSECVCVYWCVWRVCVASMQLCVGDTEVFLFRLPWKLHFCFISINTIEVMHTHRRTHTNTHTHTLAHTQIIAHQLWSVCSTSSCQEIEAKMETDNKKKAVLNWFYLLITKARLPSALQMQFQLNFPHSADELKLLLPMPLLLLLLLQLQLQQFPFSDALATIDDLYSWVRCVDDCLPTSLPPSLFPVGSIWMP